MEEKFIVNKSNNYKNLISIQNQSDKYNLKGLKFFENNDLENAIVCFFQALNFDKNYSHAYSNIGNVLVQKGEFEEAVNMYNNAINLDKNNSLYHFNLGVAFTQLNNGISAIKSYEKCLRLEPQNTKALKFLGNCYINAKDFDKALKYFRKWQEIDPLNPEPSFLQGQIHIRLGRFNLGWKLYEYGLKYNIRKPIEGYYDEKKQLWDGKPFDGNLLVYGEQGLGDQINFGTLITELLEVQQNICIKVDSRLIDLFKYSFPSIKVISKDDKISLNEYDKYISLGSLNKYFRNHTNKFLNSKFESYKVYGHKHKEIKQLFSQINGFKLGISWYSFSDKTGSNRCLSTKDLAKLISVNNINFFNIQYGNVHKQVKEAQLISGKEILRVPFIDLTNDISSVASIINNCDLIISVDNSTAHLAASLGKAVWLLLPYNADFRWMEDLTTALWYKNVTLIRQSKEGDWSNEINLIFNALNASNANVKL